MTAHQLPGCVLQVVQVDKPYKGSGKQWEMPTQDDNYHRNLQDKPWRSTLKPLNIDQPEGPSFQVRRALGAPQASWTLLLASSASQEPEKNPGWAHL